MINTMQWTARLLIAALALSFCADPRALAQSPEVQGSQAPDVNAPRSAQQNPQSGGTVDPSKGPLQPVPSKPSLPEAPSSQQSPAQQQTQPLGTAVGQRGITTGGAASKPAGSAIAPARQRQYRSLLIKLGLVAAAGVAIGTVVALSKGSPSVPPGAR